MHSRNVVFLETQTINDFEKSNKPKSTLSNHVALCPNTFPRSLDNGGATANDGTHDSHETEHGWCSD